MIRKMWVAYVAVIGIVLTILCGLSFLQYGSVLSDLIRQRLSVIVSATAQPFETIVELGLPLSMVRNGDDLLRRAEETDPTISSVYAFNSSGIILGGTGERRQSRITEPVERVFSESRVRNWSVETDDALVSGVTISDASGTRIGGLLATYPKDELTEKARMLAWRLVQASFVLWLVFAVLTWFALKWRMRNAVSPLDTLQQQMTVGVTDAGRARAHEPGLDIYAFSEMGLTELYDSLGKGDAAYRTALDRIESHLPADPDETASAMAAKGPQELVGMPETALSRRLAWRMTPVLAGLVLGSALLLGYFVYTNIVRGFVPEFERRAELVGTIASDTINRTVSAGVPLDSLVGGSEYFSHLLRDFPEVSYFAIVTDETLVEVGRRGAKAGAETGRTSATFPVRLDGVDIGSVIVEADPRYLASKFRSLLLDLAVVVIVLVLFSYELIVVIVASKVAGPFVRLQYLAGLQAVGDFSRTIAASGSGILRPLIGRLSARSAHLNLLFSRASNLAAVRPGNNVAAIDAIGRTYRLGGDRLRSIRFCSLADVRLPLFLFAMADELPLSFFSLYARSAENPIPWLQPGAVIGLPLAFYLLTALLGAPFARPLSQRYGHRLLFVAASCLTVGSNIGLFFAGNILELVVYLGIKGFGYALASLACQDYVIEMLPREVRSRSLNLFRAALFSGVFAGTALGGIMADRMGQRSVFLVCALLTVISAVMIWRMLPAEARGGRVDDAEAETPTSFDLLAPLRNPRFAAIALGVVIPMAIVDHVFISYLLSLHMDQLGASIADIGRVMMCFFLAVILAGIAYDKLPQRLAAPAGALIVASLLSGGVLTIASLYPSTGTLLLAAIGTGLGMGLAGGPQMTMAVDLAEGPLAHLGQNSVLGAVRVMERGGSIFGLFFVGSLTAAFGYAGSIGAIGAIVISGVALFTLLQAAALLKNRLKGN